MLVAVLAGPWAGGLTGLLSDIIWGLIGEPIAAAFASVAIVIGIVAGLCARYGLFRTWWQAIISGAIISVVSSIVTIPILVYVFPGGTGFGPDVITAKLLAAGKDLVGSVIITTVISNLLDKVVTALLAWGIVKALPSRVVARFPRSEAIAESE